MTLSELFQILADGELSNLAMAENGAGTIVTSSRTKIVRYINEGLLRLYSRYVLKQNDLLLQMYDSITNYHLIPRFAVHYTPAGSGDDEPIRYILDLPAEPFPDDVIKVMGVYESICGLNLPLNDDGNPLSVFTPQSLILQVPQPITDQMLSVTYQAKHPKIQGDLSEVIGLPDFLVEALTAYVAYKVFSHMTTDVSGAKAQEHLAMYEKVCDEAVAQDLISTGVSTASQRFYRNGWI